MVVTLALVSLRHADLSKFEVSLVYKVSSRTQGYTEKQCLEIPPPKKKRKEKERKCPLFYQPICNEPVAHFLQ